MFKDVFSAHLFGYKDDKISRIRCHLAEAMIELKPYYDLHEENAILVTELLQTLLQDKCKIVVEATEHAEYVILQNRKKYNHKEMLQEDAKKQKLQNELSAREKLEQEERKRR